MEFMTVARLRRSTGGLQWEIEQMPLKADDPADPELAKLVRETLARHLTPEETTVATTFGAGLPVGEVSRFALDACVRFDGTLWEAQVSGIALKKILARANHGPETPLAAREGENLVAVTRENMTIADSGRYRIVTSDWVAKNAVKYLGENPPALRERPELKLKAAAIGALGR
jgi:hypothetical protein